MLLGPSTPSIEALLALAAINLRLFSGSPSRKGLHQAIGLDETANDKAGLYNDVRDLTCICSYKITNPCVVRRILQYVLKAT